MTLKDKTTNRRRFIAGGAALLVLSLSGRSHSAGRTYKSQKEDDTPQLELCRLRRREYVDGGTNCIYKRQTGGKDALIRVDDAKVRCQAEYQCKRLN